MKIASDRDGSATFGWVGPEVYLSRFVGKVSLELGAEHVSDLQAALERSASVRYFSDCGEVTSYDLVARSAFFRMVLAHRRKFAELVFLTWQGNIEASRGLLEAALGGPLSIFNDRAEFERRLRVATPHAASLLGAKSAAARPGPTLRGRTPWPRQRPRDD